MFEGLLVGSEILQELLLLGIKLGNELLFLGHDGRVAVSNGFANDHGVLFECPAVLNVIDVVGVAEFIKTSKEVTQGEMLAL